jgi:hypothetical protein
VPGHSFRYAVEGAGLIQLYLDGQRDGVVYHTHYGQWNEGHQITGCSAMAKAVEPNEELQGFAHFGVSSRPSTS